MDNVSSIKLCTGCSACTEKCRKSAIKLEQNQYGFYVPTIDTTRCNNCGLCLIECPTQTMHNPIGDGSSYYAMWAKDENKRFQGSSGGVFGEIAETIINQGGVVYGAAFFDNCHTLRHASTEEVSLEQLKKSKYVDSHIGTSFSKIINDLKKGKKVLFCGTPCQAMGLRSLCGQKYQNLIILDFLCHGTPSHAVYNKYICELENFYGKKVKDVSFRSKLFGWRTYVIVITFDDDSKYIKLSKEDPYLRLFFSRGYNKPSCYNCNREENSEADLTLGDFWSSAAKSSLPKDDKGISIVLAHNETGEKIVDLISGNMNIENLSYTDVKHCFHKSSQPIPEYRSIQEMHFFPIPFKLSKMDRIKAFLLKHKLTRKSIYGGLDIISKIRK